MQRLHVLPPAPDKFWSSFTGHDFFPAMNAEFARDLAMTAPVVNEGRFGVSKEAEMPLGLLPIPDNDYSTLAIAVVIPSADGSLDRARQVGWVPQRRVRSIQPRIVSLMELTGGFVGVPAVADISGERVGRRLDWGTSASFSCGLSRWQDIHSHVLAIARELQPDRVQPWIANRAPGTEFSRSIYESHGGSKAVEVAFTVVDEGLVATVDGEVLSNLTGGGRDFFDLLRDRVDAQGPLRGSVVVHRTSVEVRHEEIPPSEAVSFY